MTGNVDKGRLAYARSRGQLEPTTDRELVRTALGRGHLLQRAQKGDRAAREVLRKHGTDPGQERAEYDDPTGGGGDAG